MYVMSIFLLFYQWIRVTAIPDACLFCLTTKYDITYGEDYLVLVKVFPAFDVDLVLYYYDYMAPLFTGRWIWFGYDLYYWKYHCHGFSCWWHELRVFWICWGYSLLLVLYDLTYIIFYMMIFYIYDLWGRVSTGTIWKKSSSSLNHITRYVWIFPWYTFFLF